MTDELSIEQTQTVNLAIIAALAASNGNVAKANDMLPAFVIEMSPGSRMFKTAAQVLQAKVFRFTPTHGEMDKPKPGKDPSNRFVIYGTSPTTEEGKEERPIRTHRVDTARGAAQKKFIEDHFGEEMLMHVFIDEISRELKVRILEHATLIGKRSAPSAPDPGPAPAAKPKLQGKPLSQEMWAAMFATLAETAQVKIANWFEKKYDDNAYEPKDEFLQPDSELVAVFNRAFAAQEEEMNR